MSMQPNSPMPQSPNPMSGGGNFGFIMQDAPTPKKKLLPGNGGLLSRVILIAIGLIVFLVLFNVARNIISPKPSFDGFVLVAQDQQAMSHLLDNALKQPGISEATKDFALTAQVGITNDQSETLNYLKENGQKVKPMVLEKKVSLKTDAELGGSSSPALYDSAFMGVMKSQLETYQDDLKNTYIGFKGQKGKELLDKAHSNSELLVKKLETR